MKMKKFLSLLIIGALVFGLVACTSTPEKTTGDEKPAVTDEQQPEESTEPASEPVTVGLFLPNSWASGAGGDSLKGLIAKWEAKTGNKVDIQGVQDDQYDNLVKARLTSGEGLDIFYGNYNMYDVPNVMLEISGEAFENEVVDVVLSNLRYTDGKIYGFPRPDPLEAYGAFYNKKIFNDLGLSIPKTFEEFDKVCATIKESGITPIYYSARDGWTMLQHRNGIMGNMAAAQPDVWDKLNKNEIEWKDVPSFVSQYKAVEDWVKKGYINQQLASATYEESQVALAEGKAAIVFMGSWYEGDVMAMKEDVELGFFINPTEDGNNKVPLSGYNCGAHIAKSSKVPEATKSLLRFFVEPASVKEYLTNVPGISGYKNVDVSEHLKPAVKDIQSYISAGDVAPHGDDKYVVPMPYDELVAIYQELLTGRITGDEFVQKHGEIYEKNAKQAKIAGF